MNIPTIEGLQIIKPFYNGDLTYLLIFNQTIVWRAELLTTTPRYGERKFYLEILETDGKLESEWELVWQSNQILDNDTTIRPTLEDRLAGHWRKIDPQVDDPMMTTEFEWNENWRQDDYQIYCIWRQLQIDPIKVLLRLKAVEVL